MAKNAKKPVQLKLALPSENDFKKVLRALGSHEKDKDAAVGSLREAIKNGIEKYHVNKRALAMFRSLARLNNKELQLALDHLDHYRKIGGLDERATEQRLLPLAVTDAPVKTKKKKGEVVTGSFQKKMQTTVNGADETLQHAAE